MPVKIPFNLGSATPRLTAARPESVKIGLPMGSVIKPGSGSQSGALTDSRQNEVIMAVAVAAGIYDPTESMKLAGLAKEKPEELIDPTIKEERIDRILRAVATVIDNPSKAPSASDKVKAASNIVGASPILASAALAAIKSGSNKAEKDALAKDARLWVGSLEPEFLGRAARAAARTTQLARIADPATRLAIVEKDVAGLDKRVTTLESGGGGGTP